MNELQREKKVLSDRLPPPTGNWPPTLQVIK
jgi:hypothetical protein